MFARPMFARLAARALPVAALASAVIAGPAAAHVTLAPNQAQAGTAIRTALRVPHGCDGSATTAIKVTIPDGVVGVKPMPKAGWTLAIETAPYAKPYTSHGKTISEGVKTITWSGGNLPDAQYDEFIFIGSLQAETGGQSLPFAVLQTCEKGSADWAEAMVPGQPMPPRPAPLLKVAAAAPDASVQKVGALTLETPWARATPGGAKVAGGFLKITNTGTTPDKLISATFEPAGKVEIHEMAMNNGVMSMRPLTGGLEIAPGKSVELAPGGFHLMLMDLKQPLKEGDKVKGTLVFEKAGKVEVVLDVRGLGASAPAAAGGHQH